MEYRLYCLNDIHRIVSARDLVAQDDVAAVAAAETLREAEAMEIWQGTRCVARIKKGSAALGVSVRLSL